MKIAYVEPVMTTRLYTYAVLMGAMVWFLVAPVFASSLPSADEVQLIDFINQARRAPLATAAAYGLNVEDVTASLPELKDILEEGLPPLVCSQILSTSAKAHTQDMIDRSYYSRTTPEGEGPYARIEAAGYLPLVAGESLGMLGFTNFVTQQSAVAQIFRNMFLDELDPDRTEPRNILNPNLEEVGVALGAGQRTVGGLVYNTYMVTFDFAASRETATERELLSLFNQARTWPAYMAGIYGISDEEITVELEPGVPFQDAALPPLAPEAILYTTAAGHAEDILGRSYFSTVTPEGLTPADRMAAGGYDPAATAELLGSRTAAVDTPESLVLQEMFEARFRKELTAADVPVLLNPSYTEIGLRVCDRSISPTEMEEAYRYFLLMGDLASPAESLDPRLMIFSYEDANGNGLFDMGEGAEGLPFTVVDADGNVLSSETGRGGFAALTLDPGVYQVAAVAQEGDGVEWVEIRMEDSNVALWIQSDVGID